MNRIAAALCGVFAVLAPGTVHANYLFNAFPELPSFNSPMGVIDPMDGTDRLFVIERAGRIYVFQNDATASSRSLFLNITSQITTQTEGGLLGLAFHPDYENNQFFYVTYTAESPRREVLSRFTADALNPSAVVAGSEQVLVNIPKSNLHHNGGCIAFGADGYLYWSLGEDGFPQYAQDLTRWNGKVLRIDIDHPSGGNQYGIPADNPFVANAGSVKKEIWAFGFRNPWRFSFDPPTGRLWLGDVGENSWEEINIVRKGRNYGWPRMEGFECYSPSTCDTVGLNLTYPLFVYPHEGSEAITGGFVYRGSTIPSLAGKYIYADYITGDMWALTWSGVGQPTANTFLMNVGNVPSFGVDKSGEVFIVSFDGTIYRLFATTTDVPTPSVSRSALVVAPNPFSSSTNISLTIDTPANVEIAVFDVAGRRVATIVNSRADQSVEARWDGHDASGRPASSGVYFMRLSLNGRAVETRRITLVK